MTQSTETATTVREALNFVGGEWVASSDGATFDVTDPFTGEAVVRAAAGTRDDARHAVEAAAEAFPAWAATPPGVRQGIFLRAADILESRRDEVVDLLARETGSTFGFGMFQMFFTPGAASGGRLGLRANGRGDPVRHPGRDGDGACGSRWASSVRSRRGTPR